MKAKGKTIYVGSQSEFDKVVERIKAGEEMNIVLAKKTFILNKRIEAKAPLFVKGRKSVILSYTDVYSIADTKDNKLGFRTYKVKSRITPFSLFFDINGNIIKVSESVDENIKVNHALGGVISGGDMKAGTEIKILIPEKQQHLRNKVFSKSFGYFDCGWQTVNFILERSDNSYFYCKTVNACRTGNYSYDKQQRKDFVRFVIYNAERKPGTIYYDENYLYVPENVDLLYHKNSTNYNASAPEVIVRSDFSVSGVLFRGVDGIEIMSDASKICEIRDCHFSNSLGCALRIVRTGEKVRGANIINCTFRETSLLTDYAVSMECPIGGPNYIVMNKCDVARYSNGTVSYKNADGAVGVNGNVTIVNSVIWNTPRCHIYLNGGNIIVKRNYLFNTDVFNNQKERNLSSDLGLVYCNHIYRSPDNAISNIKSKVFIESNLLYGAYAYRGDARGVFIDNGRGDVTCVNNIILNCQLYSLDSRNTMHDAASIRNNYFGNIVTTRYRLEAGKAVGGSNVPRSRANLVLTKDKSVVLNIQSEKDDIRLAVKTDASCEEGKVYVSKDLYNVLKKSNAWKGIKKNIRLKKRK